METQRQDEIISVHLPDRKKKVKMQNFHLDEKISVQSCNGMKTLTAKVL
jgi:hypothetical protein